MAFGVLLEPMEAIRLPVHRLAHLRGLGIVLGDLFEFSRRGLELPLFQQAIGPIQRDLRDVLWLWLLAHELAERLPRRIKPLFRDVTLRQTIARLRGAFRISACDRAERLPRLGD